VFAAADELAIPQHVQPFVSFELGLGW